jgi:hypothetical protein
MAVRICHKGLHSRSPTMLPARLSWQTKASRPWARRFSTIVWQFDEIGMLFLALVFLGKNFFEPICLFFRSPFISD